jgi:uncharacterized membrane protein
MTSAVVATRSPRRPVTLVLALLAVSFNHDSVWKEILIAVTGVIGIAA